MKLTITNLVPGTDYAAQVRAITDDGPSEWSLRYEFKTITNKEKPKQPQNFSLTLEGGGFLMEWDRVSQNENDTEASGIWYEVEMRANNLVRTSHIPQTADARISYLLLLSRAQQFFKGKVLELQARVRAWNDAENASAWTSLLTVNVRKPDAPTNAVVEEVIDGVKVSWDAPADDSNVDGYNVYVSTSENFTPNSLNRVYQGTETNFTYVTSTYEAHYFKIRAFSDYGLESDDLLATGTPKSPFGPDTEPPETPTLSVSLNRVGGVAKADAAWTFDAEAEPNKDIQAFVIRWRKAGESDSMWRMEYFDKNARSGSIDLPQAFNNYEFQIGSIDFVANYSAWSATVTVSGAIPGPPPKTATPTIKSSLDGLDISWAPSTAEDVTNGGKYRVQVATNSGFTAGLLEYVTGNTQIAVNGLTPGTVYYVRVQAIDVANETGAYSDTVSSTTVSFPVVELSDKVAPASSPTPSVSSEIGHLNVTWTAITNADPVTYEIHRSTVNNFTANSATKIAENGGTFYIDGNVSYGTTYYYRIIAKDRDGAGPVSGQASGTPSKAALGDISATLSDFGGINQTQLNNAIASITPTSLGVPTTTQMNSALGGKNKVTYSTSDASGAGTDGDTWFKRDASGNIIAQWEYQGGWQARKLNHQVISSIDVGNMTVIGKLGAANIEVGQLVVSSSQVSNLDSTLSGISNTLGGKVDTSVYNSAIGGINTTLGNKADTTYVNTQVTTAQAKAIDSQFQNTNVNFADWTGTFPTGWGNWNGTPIKETSIARTTPNAVRFNVNATTDMGIQVSGALDNMPYKEYITIEADVYLVSGNFSGAGILLDWSGVSSPNRSLLRFSDLEPSPATGKWYRFTKVFKRPTAAGTWTGWNSWIMANWAELNARSAKNIIFDKVGFRAATTEEITAFNTPGDISSAKAQAIADAGSAADTKISNYNTNTVQPGLTAAANNGKAAAVTELKTLWGMPGNTTLINGGVLANQSILTSKIAVADFTNYVPDPYFRTNGNYNLPGTTYASSDTANVPQTNVPQNVNVRKLPSTYDMFATAGGDGFPVREGDEYYVEAWVAHTGTETNGLALRIWTSTNPGAISGDQAQMGWAYPSINIATNGTVTGFSGASGNNETGGTAQDRWIKVSGTIKIPTTPHAGKDDPFVAAWAGLGTGGPTGGNGWYITGWTIRRRNGGELIVDGSIGANQVAADVFKGKEFTIGAGGVLKTAGGEVILTSAGIQVSGVNSSISATALRTGTFGSGQALTVDGNMLLNGNMTIQNSGYITSSVYRGAGDADPTGFRLSAAGLDVRSGTIAVGTLVGGTISAPDIRLGANGVLTVDSTGYITSNNYNASSGTGWRLSATAFDAPGLTISASKVSGDTVAGRNLIVSGSMQSSNWNGSSTGWYIGNNAITIYNGTIQGASVITNQLRSSSTDSTTGNYLFSINANGYAEFSGARIYGNTVVGSSSSTTHYMQSYNYSPGSKGWKLDAAGNFYAAGGTFYGGTITGAQFQTSESGNRAVINNLGGYGGGMFLYDTSGFRGWIGAMESGSGMGIISGGVTVGFVNGALRVVGSGGVQADVLGSQSGSTVRLDSNLSGADKTISASYLTAGYGGLTSSGGLSITGGSISVANGTSFTGNVSFSGTVGLTTVGGGASGVYLQGSGGLKIQRNTGTAETAAAANIYVNSDGILVKTSNSSRRYKTNIMDAPREQLVNGILTVRPRIYDYIGLGEQVGIVAEEAYDSGLGCFVDWENGQIENFNYARSVTAVIATVQYQEEKITQQESEIATLKDEVAELKALVQQMLDGS